MQSRDDDRHGVDRAHDPGVDVARSRAAAVPSVRAARPLGSPGGGEIRVGTASWTDPTITAAGVFYPGDASSAEDRLRFYATCFSTVEVDAPYYALPTRRNASLWAERTPDGFLFDVKANALMTGHPGELSRLPRELRDALPEAIVAKRRAYARELPTEIRDEVWAIYRDAMQPLIDAGKMGAVLLQYPRWFPPSRENRAEILEARERLGGLRVAVEFRNGAWFDHGTAERTVRFLTEHDLPFVMVDGPQGLPSSVPPIVAVTSKELAIVRLHGRRADQWERPGTTVVEKYRYLYDRPELDAWVPKVLEAAHEAREMRVVFNNCYANYGTTNAREMANLLAAGIPSGDQS